MFAANIFVTRVTAPGYPAQTGAESRIVEVNEKDGVMCALMNQIGTDHHGMRQQHYS